jgi:hypothetical protein
MEFYHFNSNYSDSLLISILRMYQSDGNYNNVCRVYTFATNIKVIHNIFLNYRIYSNVMHTFLGQITSRKLGCALDSIANLKKLLDQHGG